MSRILGSDLNDALIIGDGNSKSYTPTVLPFGIGKS